MRSQKILVEKEVKPVVPFLQRKIPVSYSTIPEVLAYEDIDASNDMSQHRIPNQNHFIESSQNFADFFSRKPSHIASSRHVGCIMANATP
jgi:hypothetical protein